MRTLKMIAISTLVLLFSQCHKDSLSPALSDPAKVTDVDRETEKRCCLNEIPVVTTATSHTNDDSPHDAINHTDHPILPEASHSPEGGSNDDNHLRERDYPMPQAQHLIEGISDGEVAVETHDEIPDYINMKNIHIRTGVSSKCGYENCDSMIESIQQRLAKLAAETCTPQGACILCCFDADPIYVTMVATPPLECSLNGKLLKHGDIQFVSENDSRIFQ